MNKDEEVMEGRERGMGRRRKRRIEGEVNKLHTVTPLRSECSLC